MHSIDITVPISFYFDESFHDRKIRITNETLMNIWRQDRAHDKYVGCFVGWPNADLSGVEAGYMTFENRCRNIFAFSQDREIKSLSQNKEDVVKSFRG